MRNLFFMFKIIIWNCCGIGNHSTINWLKNILLKEEINFIGLIEPIINQVKAETLSKEPSMEYYWTNTNNKIWIFRKNQVNIFLSDNFPQCPTFFISTTSHVFYLSVIYAFYDNSCRKRLWQYLNSVNYGEHHPWILGVGFQLHKEQYRKDRRNFSSP